MALRVLDRSIKLTAERAFRMIFFGGGLGQSARTEARDGPEEVQLKQSRKWNWTSTRESVLGPKGRHSIATSVRAGITASKTMAPKVRTVYGGKSCRPSGLRLLPGVSPALTAWLLDAAFGPRRI